MALRPSFSVDGATGDLGAAMRSRLGIEADDTERRIATAHTAAMKAVAAQNVGELRSDVAAGGFYNAVKLSKTWQSRVYPSGGVSMEPAAYIFNKADRIIDAFSLGLTISAASRRFLAIPVGPAKAIVRRLNQAKNRTRDDLGRFVDESSTVQRVAAALGVPRLEAKIDKSLGAGVLVAPGQKMNDRGRRTKRGDDTVLFVLVRQATLKARIKGRALLPAFDARFGAQFDAAVSARIGAGDHG